MEDGDAKGGYSAGSAVADGAEWVRASLLPRVWACATVRVRSEGAGESVVPPGAVR